MAWTDDSTEGMHTPLLTRIARLESEVAEQRRVIWLLVRKLGGVAFITDAELAACPDLPGGSWTREPEGVFLAAQQVNPAVKSAVIRREIEVMDDGVLVLKVGTLVQVQTQERIAAYRVETIALNTGGMRTTSTTPTNGLVRLVPADG